jgi:branched-chain amino acid transport system substrate-binding protein
MVPYNENQTSYRAEVNKAMADKPDALFLAAYPQDGATITREWLSLGGTQNFMFHNALRTKEFVEAVGPKFLQAAIGYDNASVEGPTVDAFRNSFKAKYNYEPVGAGILPQYDAVMVLALAMNIAPDLSGPAIRDSVRKIQESGGTVIGTGPEEFRKALAAIKEKRAIRYVGATGAVEFDKFGDVAGPILLWSVKGSDLVVDKTMTVDDINQIMKAVDQ